MGLLNDSISAGRYYSHPNLYLKSANNENLHISTCQISHCDSKIRSFIWSFIVSIVGDSLLRKLLRSIERLVVEDAFSTRSPNLDAGRLSSLSTLQNHNCRGPLPPDRVHNAVL